MPRHARLTTVSWGPASPAEGTDPVESNVSQAIETIDSAYDGGDLICLSRHSRTGTCRSGGAERAEPVCRHRAHRRAAPARLP